MSTSLSLYTLTTELQAVAAKLAEDGLDDQTIRDTIDSISGPFEEKAKAVASVAKNFRALAEQIKQAESEMEKRRKSLEAQAARIDDYILRSMIGAGIEKIECPWFRLAVRKNPPSVEITDELQIPARYFRHYAPPPPSIDKQSILADLKQGAAVPGARLTNSHRLETK